MWAMPEHIFICQNVKCIYTLLVPKTLVNIIIKMGVLGTQFLFVYQQFIIMYILYPLLNLFNHKCMFHFMQAHSLCNAQWEKIVFFSINAWHCHTTNHNRIFFFSQESDKLEEFTLDVEDDAPFSILMLLTPSE